MRGSVICTASSVGGLAATAPPRLLPLLAAAGEVSPTDANPAGRPLLLPAAAAADAGPAPSGDTRATASRDTTAIESNGENQPAKIHHPPERAKRKKVSGNRAARRAAPAVKLKPLTRCP